MTRLIVTNAGRPLGRFPKWELSDGDGGFLLELVRVDVSDVGKAEPFYLPLVKVYRGDGMTSVEIRMRAKILILFFTKWRVQYYVTPNQLED